MDTDGTPTAESKDHSTAHDVCQLPHLLTGFFLHFEDRSPFSSAVQQPTFGAR